jgi:hypothetical protein
MLGEEFERAARDGECADRIARPLDTLGRRIVGRRCGKHARTAHRPSSCTERGVVPMPARSICSYRRLIETTEFPMNIRRALSALASALLAFVERFDIIAQPANSYVLALADGNNPLRRLTWCSEENGRELISETEPGNDRLRDLKADLLSLLPLDDLL